MPMFNAEKRIRETIESVQQQTYTNWNLIIVDDCSRDKSQSLVQEISKFDSRVVLLKASQNGGPAKARNIALQSSSSRYIAFLDSDDLWLPTKLEESLNVLENGDDVFVCTSYKRSRQGVMIVPYLTCPFRTINRFKLSLSNWVYTSTVVVSAERAGEFYMEPSAYYDDYLCWWRLLKQGKGRFLNKPLTIYVENAGSVSSNKYRSAVETWRTKRDYMDMGILSAFFTTITYLFFGILKVKGRNESSH